MRRKESKGQSTGTAEGKKEAPQEPLKADRHKSVLELLKEYNPDEVAERGVAAIPEIVRALRMNFGPNDLVSFYAGRALVRIGPKAIPALESAMERADWLLKSKIIEVLGDIKDVSAVGILERRLGEKNADVQAHCIIALRKIAEENPEYGWAGTAVKVAQFLRSRDRDMRWYARGALVGFKEAAPVLEALGNKDADVRLNAGNALAMMGGVAVPGLMRVLVGRDKIAAEEAASVLSRTGESAAREIIPKALREKDGAVRERFSRVLIKIGEPAASILSGCMENERHRERAADLLVEMGEPAAPALLEALKSRNYWVRKEATFALVKVGRAAGAKMLAALRQPFGEITYRELHNIGKQSGDVELVRREILGRIIWAIGKMRLNVAAKPLMEMFAKEEGLQGEIVNAIGKIGDRDCSSFLADALRHKNYHVRVEAARALGNMLDRAMMYPLERAMEDEEEAVRVEAVKAIAKIGIASVPYLAKAVQKRDVWVSDTAGEELEKIVSRFPEYEWGPVAEILREEAKNPRYLAKTNWPARALEKIRVS